MWKVCRGNFPLTTPSIVDGKCNSFHSPRTKGRRFSANIEVSAKERGSGFFLMRKEKSPQPTISHKLCTNKIQGQHFLWVVHKKNAVTLRTKMGTSYTEFQTSFPTRWEPIKTLTFVEKKVNVHSTVLCIQMSDTIVFCVRDKNNASEKFSYSHHVHYVPWYVVSMAMLQRHPNLH